MPCGKPASREYSLSPGTTLRATLFASPWFMYRMQRGHSTPWVLAPYPNPEQASPLKNFDRIFFRKECFQLTFWQSRWLNKHNTKNSRTLKTSRYTPDKLKQVMKHNIMLREWELINAKTDDSQMDKTLAHGVQCPLPLLV